MKDYAEMKKHVESRCSMMKQELNTFAAHFQELSEYIRPRMSRINVADANKDRRNTKILDNTATMAANTLASGMMTGVTNPATIWFRLAPGDMSLNENQPVKNWLYSAEERMREVMLRSNLYNSLAFFYWTLGVFGTAALFAEEDFKDVVRFHALPIGSFGIATSPRGDVTELCRWFELTVKQLVDKFGIDNVSDRIASAYKTGSWSGKYTVYHYIGSNDWAEYGKLDASNKPFVSIYYESGCPGDKFLRVSGYDYFPAMVARWSVTGEDSWGDSPGMVALPDIKGLQLTERRKLETIEKIARPPMAAPSTLKNQRQSILAGDVTYLDVQSGGQGFTPLYQINPAALQSYQLSITECQQRIKRAFFEDLFLMLASAQDMQRTATEIVERKEEKMLVLGAVINRLNEELLNPLVDIVFYAMFKRNMFDEAPEELHNLPLNVDYVSVLAQSQKLVGMNGLERFVQFVGTIAAAKPSVLDKWDADQTVDEYAGMVGVPPTVIVSDDNVAAIRKQQAQAAQQQAQMEQAQQQSVTAKNLSQANTSGQNALTDMMAGS